jgi:phage gp37-like protein
MVITDVETAIVDKLKADIDDLAVEPYPDNVKDYELIHPNGAVLVSYEGSNFTNPRIEQQARMLEFGIIVIVRNLRNQYGAYETLERVRQSVTNDLYIENTRLYPISEKFLFVEDDKWHYEMRFMLPSVYFIGE